MPTQQLLVTRSEMDLLFYEIERFNRVDPSGSSHVDQVNRDAHLESVLLHARNLIDFLEDNRTHGDDLTCSDFNDRDGIRGTGYTNSNAVYCPWNSPNFTTWKHPHTLGR